jgi:hypothetical protein
MPFSRDGYISRICNPAQTPMRARDDDDNQYRYHDGRLRYYERKARADDRERRNRARFATLYVLLQTP